MLHFPFLPRIVQPPRHRANQIKFSIRFLQEQQSTVAADLAAIEVPFDRSLF
jgi:hypothetical protein